MVTILPIDVDQDLVREGLQYAIAERFGEKIKAITAQLAELRSGGCINREKWTGAFGELAAIAEEMSAALEYAEAFEDQWPEETDAEP